MKTYAIILGDAENVIPLRKDRLAAHLAHIEQVMDRLLVAGPLRDAAGTVNGSLLVVRATDEADARALLEADPYYQAGIWRQVDIRPFDGVAGAWVGGRNW